MCIRFDLINHHCKLKFVGSGFYFGQDENNFINQLLQVESRSFENVSDAKNQQI